MLQKFVPDPRVDFVAFTGSVKGGRAVQEAAALGKGFKGVALELGGKDPAYVREDADPEWTAEQLVDGESIWMGTIQKHRADPRRHVQLRTVM